MSDYAIPPGRADDSQGIIRTSDRAFIPNDPGNRDWQAYAAWKAEGNEPDPEPPQEEPPA